MQGHIVFIGLFFDINHLVTFGACGALANVGETQGRSTTNMFHRTG
jgi:hypothetical protein